MESPRPRSRLKRLFPVKENKSHGPEARSGHRIVVDEGDIYCYGGYNPSPQSSNREDDGLARRNMDEFPMFRELWKFNLASQQWKKLQTTGTIPRESASYACILLNGKLLLFGGTGFPFAEVRNNCLYSCDLTTLVWTKLNCSGSLPGAVYGHSMLYLDGYIYLFGGTTGFFYNNEMYRLDMNSKDLVWECISSPQGTEAAPSPRYRHEMATDGKYLFVFGGGTSASAESLKSVWAFNIAENAWEEKQTIGDPVHEFPLPRKCHGCVQQGDYVYITGGLGDGNRPAFKDVWRFSMSHLEWTKLSIILRKEVYFHATAISQNSSMYTFGGVLTQQQTDNHNNNPSKRSRALYKVDMGVKSLADICWEKIISKSPHILKLPMGDLLMCGIPKHFIDRLDSSTLQSQEMVALAS